MPQDLPGFYYDPEKNRYFPIKGPIPGTRNTSSVHTQRPSSKPDQATEKPNICRRKGIKTAKLLQVRELYGNVVTFNKWKCNFQHEYQKIQASQPMIWKYQNTDRIGDGALEQLHVDILTPEGQNETDVLLTGSINGSLSLYGVGKVGQHFDYGVKCMPDRAWPLITENQADCNKGPGHIWKPSGASILMPSNISCIKRAGKHSAHTANNGSTIQRALTLASPCKENFACLCHGTNLGAALVNLETGVPSWVCRSKSDVFSQQFDQSGNVVLCGLRNGAILTVDVRQKQGFSSSLPRHQIRHPSHKVCEGSFQKFSKQWFEVKGNVYPSHTIFMPSSVSSLVALQFYDQYFLASSMDGSIKLYDHRMTQRRALQSYEGHVNSHTRIQLGVDPSERFVMSGGEDYNVRIWSIKTGELLFGAKFMNSVPSTICCPELFEVPDERQNYKECIYGQKHSMGAWIGSQDGLFYMHGT
ncbi:hypothetical protein HHK36_000601 [Tetracentron sinense]|uniref:Uncharacterized protein n=1 Tax=Tetracentron sinense TaxID=13715 RepID=A0A834ZUD7_TETSI|nr:hypothetical protein HHK36_000601 [Tetracentron sinense]